MVDEDGAVVRPELRLAPARLVPAAPAPRVPAPERRQHVQPRRLRAAVRDRDAEQDVLGRGLRVLGEDVEVAPLVEDAGVGQLELGVGLAAAPALLDEPRVRELGLRVLVERLQVRGGRGGVEVVVELLDVLAVVALGAGQAEQALLEDRVALVPEREREARRGTGGRRCRAGRPRPSGRRGCGRGRAGRSPRPRRAASSPRGRCPTGARTGTAPSASSSARGGRPRGGVPPRTQAVYTDASVGFRRRLRDAVVRSRARSLFVASSAATLYDSARVG